MSARIRHLFIRQGRTVAVLADPAEILLPTEVSVETTRIEGHEIPNGLGLVLEFIK